MIKKIILGYKNLFLTASKLLLLLFLCAGAGALVVFPLWKFATSSPRAYTLFILVVAAGVVLALIARSIKKSGVKSFAKSLLKFLILAGGISLCAALVFAGKRFFALPVLIAMIFLYGLVAFKK